MLCEQVIRALLVLLLDCVCCKCRWATVLPVDAAKTRIQTATPGSPKDVGILRNLRMMYGEGELLSVHSLGCLGNALCLSQKCLHADRTHAESAEMQPCGQAGYSDKIVS